MEIWAAVMLLTVLLAVPAGVLAGLLELQKLAGRERLVRDLPVVIIIAEALGTGLAAAAVQIRQLA
jgi:hypothetical protein